ncbi:hypothetical protein [Mycobacterium sp. P7213]|nr:hypothetical protein [Mycobacterium sp. P7213]
MVTDHPEYFGPVEDFALYRVTDRHLGEVILTSQFGQGDDAVAL